MIDYLPNFVCSEGLTWNVLSMNFCVDWGGRQCQIECQTELDGKFPTKTFVVYGIDGEFRQWASEEVVDCHPVKDMFYECVMNMFKMFGKGEME